MNKISFMDLFLGLYLFFYYIRANGNIILFLFSIFFIGLSIYHARNNIFLIFLFCFIALTCAYLTFLKEKGHPFILKLQKGYKPIEKIIHAVIFFIIVFLFLLFFT